MIKIKHFVLGVVGAALITVGLFSCSNEVANSPQQEESLNMTTSSITFEKEAIATVVENTAVPLYDETDLSAALISENLFSEIESIELNYYFNTDEDKQEAFFTIVGKTSESYLLEAFVAELVIEDDILYIMNPATTSGLFMNHTCDGVNCSSCDFKRDKWLKITGCKPCPEGEIIDDGKPAGCAHSKTTGGNLAVVMVIIQYT